MLVCIAFVHGAHETSGAARIRHSLRPLISFGRDNYRKVRAFRAAGSRRRVYPSP
jgi:hypothetical protein